MAGPRATLLRLLFPTWAFFERPHAPPLLEVRVGNAANEAPWHPAFVPPSRRWWHVFVNPVGTFVLAAQTHVERFYELCCASPREEHSREFLLAWRVVRNLSEQAARARRAEVNSRDWQFRITVTELSAQRVVYESENCP